MRSLLALCEHISPRELPPLPRSTGPHRRLDTSLCRTRSPSQLHRETFLASLLRGLLSAPSPRCVEFQHSTRVSTQQRLLFRRGLTMLQARRYAAPSLKESASKHCRNQSAARPDGLTEPS